ncbi:MAG: enoyl-CoA hydratase/isomerase family protein [Deltaproteobacteria bacterium]|nr:enoyl-CoA hydratase/isomerase family protein [Deltaproteobacteria bacterium]
MVAITDVVSLENHGEIAVITVDNPPVNALGVKVRKGLADGITAAIKDDSVKGIVILCKGRTFIAGADITEFGKPAKEPGLNIVLDTIENSTKPVIPAIHGTALGGGLEVSMACHFRVAVASAKFGQPEVKIGLIPGAAGTQRLPRIVGPEKALKMIAIGDPIDAKESLADGLIDEIIEGDLEAGAIEFAKKVLAEGRPLKKVSEMNEKVEAATGNAEIFDNFRKSIARKTRGFEAPEACVKAVEASVNMSFADGVKYERKLFEELMAGTQSAAQRYAFFAERQANKIPDIPKDTPQFEINKAAVLGAGTMGGGIAMNFINAGIPVTLLEVTQEALDRGIGIIRKNYEISAARGRFTQEQVEERMSMITGTLSMDDFSEADIVIEAVFENMDLKKEIFSKLDNICKKDAILASNTSFLNINEIADQTTRPESVLGLHFFSPANVMRLLEMVRGDKTSKSVIATSMSLAKRINKIAVLVGVCHGFVGNRMFSQRTRETDSLALEGAMPPQVDKVLYDFGFPMGPFVLRDLIGLDIGWSKETSTGSTIREILCEKDRRGQKTGAGYYTYKKGSREPIWDSEVEKLIIEFSEKKNINRREISDEEIIERSIYPIVNEGAKILEEGIATRASDIDVIWLNGYGWPIYLGGPMFWADLIGLDKILETLKKFNNQFGDEWKPAPLLEKLVKEGKQFKDF